MLDNSLLFYRGRTVTFPMHSYSNRIYFTLYFLLSLSNINTFCGKSFP